MAADRDEIAIATFIDYRPGGGRAVTRAVLGHSGRKTATDHYVYASMEDMAANLAAYEAHVLAADPTRNDEPGDVP